MSDKAIDTALRRRDGLAAEINRLNQEVEAMRAELRRVDAWILDWRKFAGETDVEDTLEERIPPKPVSESPKSTGRRALKNPAKEDVAEAARELILAKGGPVTRNEVYAHLENIGMHVSGADPKMVVSTMLWRMKSKIVRLRVPGKGFRYWLTERPYEPTGYIPEWMGGGEPPFKHDPAEEEDAHETSDESPFEQIVKKSIFE